MNDETPEKNSGTDRLGPGSRDPSEDVPRFVGGIPIADNNGHTAPAGEVLPGARTGASMIDPDDQGYGIDDELLGSPEFLADLTRDMGRTALAAISATEGLGEVERHADALPQAHDQGAEARESLKGSAAELEPKTPSVDAHQAIPTSERQQWADERQRIEDRHEAERQQWADERQRIEDRHADERQRIDERHSSLIERLLGRS